MLLCKSVDVCERTDATIKWKKTGQKITSFLSVGKDLRKDSWEELQHLLQFHNNAKYRDSGSTFRIISQEKTNKKLFNHMFVFYSLAPSFTKDTYTSM